jgi:hypothetical protein
MVARALAQFGKLALFMFDPSDRPPWLAAIK